MTIRAFGPHPLPHTMASTDTPVGAMCDSDYCDKVITADDEGFTMPAVAFDGSRYVAAYHRACLLRCLGLPPETRRRGD